MTSDLRECCQRAAIDGVSPERHFPHCDARRVGRPPVPLSAFCSCGHVEVLHGIRGNGSRGTCSISSGAKAVPCGCKAFAAAEPDALFDLPMTNSPKGGTHP